MKLTARERVTYLYGICLKAVELEEDDFIKSIYSTVMEELYKVLESSEGEEKI